jgi:hypothetical protein
MKTTNDGGPAFPTVARDGNWQPHHDGLSLRDYLAGRALTGILMNYTTAKFELTEISVAVCAYKFADAMLAAREEGKQ